jgi:hypothetical protein
MDLARSGSRDAALVMTLEAVSGGELPVTLVVHEDDETGGWQFLTSLEWRKEDLILVHRHHLYEADPSLHQLETLPAGQYAMRDAEGSPWAFGSLDEIPQV